MADQTAVVSVDAAHGTTSHETGFFTPDIGMIVLTWVTFFLLLGILYKFAWKPILAALDDREARIRKSLDEAERIKKELEQLDVTRQRLLTETEVKAKEMIDRSRKAARDAARIIQDRARDEAQILVTNARREIKEEVEKAEADLRAVSANIAVGLAAKIIEENLDNTKNQKLINRYIKEIEVDE